MSKHVMVDIETLGSKPGSVILSIGACEFNSNGITSHFYTRIDVGSSILNGLTVDQDTVNWWKAQDGEAVHAALYQGDGDHLDYALNKFAKFVDKDTYLWAKGPDFDCVLLGEAYKAAGIKVPWSFRNTRDVRTILDLSDLPAITYNGHKHNALSDAVCQAKDVIAAAEKLGVKL